MHILYLRRNSNRIGDEARQTRLEHKGEGRRNGERDNGWLGSVGLIFVTLV